MYLLSVVNSAFEVHPYCCCISSSLFSIPLYDYTTLYPFNDWRTFGISQYIISILTIAIY